MSEAEQSAEVNAEGQTPPKTSAETSMATRRARVMAGLARRRRATAPAIRNRAESLRIETALIAGHNQALKDTNPPPSEDENK